MCSTYVIDSEEQYKYLGCVVDKHLKLKNMVEERALVGKNALGAYGFIVVGQS